MIEIKIMPKVKNLRGTSDEKCSCSGSWIKHWERKSGLSINYCKNTICFSKATLGAHIKKIGQTDNSHYIIPLCDSCSKLSDEFYVPNYSLVSAICN